jgi:hypothetical protein
MLDEVSELLLEGELSDLRCTCSLVLQLCSALVFDSFEVQGLLQGAKSPPFLRLAWFESMKKNEVIKGKSKKMEKCIHQILLLI